MKVVHEPAMRPLHTVAWTAGPQDHQWECRWSADSSLNRSGHCISNEILEMMIKSILCMYCCKLILPSSQLHGYYLWAIAIAQSIYQSKKKRCQLRRRTRGRYEATSEVK